MARCSWLLLAVAVFACGDNGPPPPQGLPTIAEIAAFEDLNPDPTILEVELSAQPAQVELVPGHLTDVFAFNGQVPGPLLHARVGHRIIVHFTNQLAEATTIHWHGLRISDAMDGTLMVQSPIAPGATFTYDFVVPDAGTFWFHPHPDTVEQIDRGLYGAIVVAEAEPPVFSAERVFMVDDIRLDDAFQIEPYAAFGPDVMFGRVGNHLLVNGRAVNDVAAVSTATVPRGAVERWRLVNSSGAKTFILGVTGASWRVIGTDGGLLPAPYQVSRLSIGVGQRFDLEVTHDLDTPSAELMIYGTSATVAARVLHQGTVDVAAPRYPVVTLPEIPAAPIEKELVLSSQSDGFTINGEIGGHDGDHVLEQFQQGVPVRFRIVNDIVPMHPFHLHGQFFQILTRNGAPANDPGLKDTVVIGDSQEVTVLTWFENPGRWMYHCHIPEHAKLGMMAELQVLPSGASPASHSH